MALTSEIIFGFQGTLLSSGYDNPQPTPEFHKELWELACSDAPRVAVAAPRGHAKSTAVTHSYVLANVLFRESTFVLLISNTEGQASQFLGDIKKELAENDDLRDLFGIDKFLKETETDIIVRTKDRQHFRIVAKGSGQKLRGVKWFGRRPDLIVCDDMEDDDQVMNQDRRTKFRNWFYNALLPAGSDHCKIRMVGTILHLDSLLERLMNDSTWVSQRYAAHDEDFSWILWPEKFPQERLEMIRQGYINQGNAAGYYQEYLNVPIDPYNAYFRPTDFQDMADEDYDAPKNYYAAADFAISSKQHADRTTIVVGGIDPDGYLSVVDLRIGRWDSKEIIDELISVQRMWDPEIFTVESGHIEKSIGPYLNEEMLKTGVFLNLHKEVPTQDKETRARSIQARMRAGGVKFDKEAPWYQELEDELLTFPRGRHDDIVDAMAWLGLTLDKYSASPTQEEIEYDEWEAELDEYEADSGVNRTTGY
jgi:predicted phage terminase large subunit-like protein